MLKHFMFLTKPQGRLGWEFKLCSKMHAFIYVPNIAYMHVTPYMNMRTFESQGVSRNHVPRNAPKL